MGRSGLATQAIAAIDIALWDLKVRRTGLPLAKLLGAHRDSVVCYNTSGGFLSMSIEQVVEDARASVRRGIGGIKIKVGHPDALVEERRDGSMYDLAEISEAEACAIMECARASYLRPGAG